MSEHHRLSRRIIIIIACVIALAIASLVALEWLRPSVVRRVGGPIQEVAEALTPGLSRYVVIVSIDGLRADAIEAYPTPTIHRLMRTGRYTLEARTVVPSKTLPAHTSMLTGAAVARHGVTWNEARPDSARRVPTIFERARRAGLSTAAFFSKPKFEGLASGEGFDYVQRPVGGVIGMLADDVDDDVEDVLPEHHPHLLFIHIADPDYAGHLTGWMTPLYGRAVSSADASLDDILESADEAYGAGEYTVIVTADHGGHGRDHTGAVPEDVLIPWIVAGEGVAGAGPIREPVTIMDTGVTALWLLGLPVDEQLEGRVIRSAFASPSVITRELISPSSAAPSSAAPSGTAPSSLTPSTVR